MCSFSWRNRTPAQTRMKTLLLIPIVVALLLFPTRSGVAADRAGTAAELDNLVAKMLSPRGPS